MASDVRDRPSGPRRLTEADREQIRKDVAAGRSQAEVARRWNLAESTVSRIARRVDRRAAPDVLDRGDLERFLARDLTVRSMAAQLGVDEALVRRSLRRHWLPVVSEEWVRVRYVDRQMTLAAIAAEAGCAPWTILRALRRAGIPTRPPGTYDRSVRRPSG